MMLSRRQFGAATMSGLVAPLVSRPAFAQASKNLSGAIEAIRAYGGQHLAHFGLPGMTLGLTTPYGLSTVLNFGFADRSPPRLIGPETLFQVGSITKVMTGAVLHQLAAEGRFRLTDRISALLPSIPLPPGNLVTVQDLLDHVSGLPADAPVSPPGGLWTGFAPGSHWHYSNTGYDILGMLAEQIGGEPLARLFEKRIFAPAGMSRSRGAILAADKALYAQGYQAADPMTPFAIGTPLVPAPWVDVTSGAISVGATAIDMIRFMRSLGEVANGRGGLGLPPAAGMAFAQHAVSTDTPATTYGNGLMHVASGGRKYLHHTGGMVSFSSSFHLDVVSGAGAFACSNISAFAEYRPRLLTQFAVDTLTAVTAGRPVPRAPSLTTRLANATSYVGSYTGPTGGFEVRRGSPLTIVANGRSADLQPWGGELFRTTHPDFHPFTLMFDRRGPAIAGASWGAASFAHAGFPHASPPAEAALAPLTGSYVNDSPWWGTLKVVQRDGRLWLGTETPLTLISGNLWRVGGEPWSPERAEFADFVNGRPNTFILSGERFVRGDG
ncbi:CubicO group peptidase (beta-lactamase class C family) [Sphingomonas sp. F9_3S_D5_B_2]